MPLTLIESQSLCNSSWMREKIKTCVATYTNYMQDTSESDPNYQNIKTTATRIGQQADMVVSTVSFALSGDLDLQTAGAGISDSQLQLLVEKQIKVYYPVPPAPTPPPTE